MPSILIADAYKSSLVMTSEVFKDKILGATIFIAKTGKDCLALVEQQKFDMIVVDFDLPDADGINLTKMLRKIYSGPILLTAFPDPAVKKAIENELFPYRDVSEWIKKPVSTDVLSGKIDRYLLDGERVRKRYQTSLDAMLIGKGAGRGKRAPKVKGNVINLSIGGALLKLDNQLKMKIGEEVSLNLSLQAAGLERKVTSKKAARTKEESTKKIDDSSVANKGLTKIKAKIAWSNKSKKEAGIYFENLTENHRKVLENLLKTSEEI